MNKKYIHIYTILEQLKQQSECIDKQVACIITNKEYNILGYGINEIMKCNKNCHDKENRLCNVLHAEVVAISQMDDYILKNDAYYAFINLFPCVNCQLILAKTNIKKIICFNTQHKKQVFEDIEIVENLGDELLIANGEEKQLFVIIGELGELITEICDYFNDRVFKKKNKCIEKVIDEIIDVELMIGQLKRIIFHKDNEFYNKLRKMRIEKHLKLHDKLKSFYNKDL